MVQGHGVEAGEHADVGHHGGIVLGVAVAVGRDLVDDAHMEVRAALDDGLGVFGHALVEDDALGVEGIADGVEVAHADAAAAAGAQVMVDAGLVVVADADGRLGAIVRTGLAATAFFGVDAGLADAVHGHLARTAAAAHADVLDGTAEAGQLVPLEVGQADEDVGIHDGAADEGALEVVAAFQGHFHLVGALEAVGDDHLAAGAQGREAVLLGGGQMFQGVLAAAHIQGVAVGQEGAPAQGGHFVGHHLGEVGTQEGQVARLTEMDLDGHELVVHVDAVDAGLFDQFFQLVQQAGAHGAAHVGEIDFGSTHCRLFSSVEVRAPSRRTARTFGCYRPYWRPREKALPSGSPTRQYCFWPPS